MYLSCKALATVFKKCYEDSPQLLSTICNTPCIFRLLSYVALISTFTSLKWTPYSVYEWSLRSYKVMEYAYAFIKSECSQVTDLNIQNIAS